MQTSEINVLIALGFVMGAAAIGVLVWWHLLRKLEKEERRTREGPDGPSK